MSVPSSALLPPSQHVSQRGAARRPPGRAAAASSTGADAAAVANDSTLQRLVANAASFGGAGRGGSSDSSASSASTSSTASSSSDDVDVFAGFDRDYDGLGDDAAAAAAADEAPSLAAAARQREAVLAQVFGAHAGAGVDVATSIAKASAKQPRAPVVLDLDAPIRDAERDRVVESRHRRVASDIGGATLTQTTTNAGFSPSTSPPPSNRDAIGLKGDASMSPREASAAAAAPSGGINADANVSLGRSRSRRHHHSSHRHHHSTHHHHDADIGYDAGHEFTSEVIKKLETHESLDFTEPVTELYIEYLGEIARRGGRRLKVVIIIAIGVVVGLWATLLFHTIDALSALKMKTTLSVLADHGRGAGFLVHVAMSTACAIVAAGCCAWYPGAAGSGVPEVMSFLNGVEMQGQFNLKILLLKTLSCTGAVVSGMPVGAEGPMIHIGALIGRGVGSGHSRTLGVGKGAVRGVFRPFLNPRDRRDFVTTGAAAGVTSVFGSALGGLLFVMEEVASFFPQRLAWKTFVACLVTYAIQQLANSMLDGWVPREDDKESPIHYLNPETHTVGTENHRDPLTIHETVATLFNMRVVAAQLVPLDLRALLPAALVGVATALIGVGFIALHLNIARRWRGRFVRPHKRRFVAEPVLTAIFFAVVWFAMPIALPCERIPDRFFDPSRLDLRDLTLATQFCDENADLKDATRYPSLKTSVLWTPAPLHVAAGRTFTGKFVWDTTTAPPKPTPPPPAGVPRYHSPFASLSMTSSYNAIRLLFSRHAQSSAEEHANEFLFPPYVVALYLVLYGVGAAYCVGMCMASGVVIPTLLIGALIGRLICGGWWHDPSWANAGVAAFVGAAGFFAGLSRLTFSVVVIMVEITNDLSHVPLLMVAVLVAKQIADRFNHSLYHEQLAARGVPFLDFDRQIHKLDCFTAGDIMTPRPKTLPIVASLRDIVALLRAQTDASFHHGFPVVRPPDFDANDKNGKGEATEPQQQQPPPPAHHHPTRPKLLGLITRDELRRLLWYVALWHREHDANAGRMEPALDDLVASASESRSPRKAPPTRGASVFADANDDDDTDDFESRRQGRRSSGDAASRRMPVPTYKDLQDVEDLRFWERLPPLPEEFEALAENINRGDFDDGAAADGDCGSDDVAALHPGAPIPVWLKRIANAPMDLTPFVNLSTAMVLDTTCVSQVYGLFRNLHLRHLCVVSSRNGLKGIITRRDLLGPSLAARCTQAFLKQRDKAADAAMRAAVAAAERPSVPSASLPRSRG